MPTTRSNGVLTPATKRWYAYSMQIMARDLEVIRLVGNFSQLTSTHISMVIFGELASKTPAKRVLARLTRDKYLHRLNRRLPGGSKGGSPLFVYTLGPEAWKLYTRSTWRPMTSVNYHTLAIADAYVALLDSQQALGIEVKQVITEPETHTVIAGADLRPDLFVAVDNYNSGRTYHFWLEVDLATERPKQITEMLDRYVHAWEHSGIYYEVDESGQEVEVQRGANPFPRVVFLVPNKERARVIEGLVKRQPEEARALFVVIVQESFPQGLM